MQNDWDLSEFNWQEGYGVLTFGEERVGQVIGYLQKQASHHRDKTLYGGLERWEES